MSLTLMRIINIALKIYLLVERRQDLRFPFEAGEPVRVVGERLGQHLDRHVAIQFRVVGTVDFAHSARANLADDFVDAETRAGG